MWSSERFSGLHHVRASSSEPLGRRSKLTDYTYSIGEESPMHSSLRDALLTIALTAGISIGLAARNPQEHQHPAEGAHHHPAAAALKNPVAADATSIAAGQKLYAKNC